jgi:cytosine/adenosine deaminase-related metal-dependent hydrolase
MTTYTARWLLPASGPPLEGGVLTIAGDRIAAVGPRGSCSADINLGNVAIIPGLVNAHTHLDLSGARGLTPPTDADHFTDWLRLVIAYRRGRTAEQVRADVRAGLAEVLASGTTLLGDITAGGASWQVVSEAAVRAVVFHEFIGLTAERARQSWGELLAWEKAHPPTPAVRPAVSPHAPYSARMDFIRSFAWHGWTMTVHVAESPAEVTLVHDRSGPFETFLRDLGIWEPGWIVPSFDWLLWRTRRGGPKLLAHCNYLPADADVWPNQSVVYCPRTHAAFGHPPHPFRGFLARGVRVCLGTDGLTSNPDLDILAEARFVAARHPDLPGETLLRMVTLSGAEALGWADECGSLDVGKSADFVAVPLPDRDGDPHALLFGDDRGPRRTWFRGVERH